MPYANYSFYQGAYFGSLISADDWPALSAQGSAEIDRLTFGRLQHGAAVTDAVKMAVCAVAEVLYTHRLEESPGNIKAETVSGDSVTYESAQSTRRRHEVEKVDAVDRYLLRSDPLRAAVSL